MSLILEALNRSANERQADANKPGLDTPAYVDEPSPGRTWLTGLPWVVLLLALLAIGWLLFDKYTAVPTQKPGEVVRDQQQVNSPDQLEAEVEVASPVVHKTESPDTQLIPTGSVASSPAKSTPPEPVLSDPAVEALYAEQSISPKQPPPPKRQQANRGADAKNKAKPSVQTTQSAIDIEEVLTRTEEALKTARLQEHSAPFIIDLSQQFKDDVPTIMYRHHDYSSTPGKSSVILNNKTVRAGGKIPGGVKVEEILPDSVVLSFKDKQFRLRALNSWINF